MAVTRIGSITVAPTPPDCPFMGDEWWNTVNGQLFVYYDDGDTRQWVVANRSGPVVTGGGGSSVTTSDTPPASPHDGDLWWNSTAGKLFVWYDDGNSSQWVPATSATIGPAGPVGPVGPAGPTGPTGPLPDYTPDWDPLTEPINGLTSPNEAVLTVGGKYDTDQLEPPDPVPGLYQWGLNVYQVNIGTAPVTALAGRARASTAYPVSSSGRVYGVDPTIHGVEITVGAWRSTGTATVTSGSDTLTEIVMNAGIDEGSRWEATMPISGTGIPVGATILSVVGRPGAPTSIQMSAPATASGTAVAIAASPAGQKEVVGLLVTGNSGTEQNDTGTAIQVQAQNPASSFYKGINFGASSLRSDGEGLRFALTNCNRGIAYESATMVNGIYASSTFSGAFIQMSSMSAVSGMAIASCSFTNAIALSNTTFTSSAISFSSVTATAGLSFTASSTFSIAAINLAAQNIATDTAVGSQIATNSTQKLGFWGKTPVARPAAIPNATGGTIIDVEGRAAINALLAALRTLGLLAP